ncbi:MAG: hypothetical protein JSW55_09650, partial [Chloroflexota bacterium]
MRLATKTLLLPVLLLWLTAVIVFYYWGHQYTLIPAIIAILRLVLQLTVLGLIGVVAFGLGRLLSRVLRLAFISRFEEVVYSIGLGLGLMSLLALGFGLAGLIGRPLFWLLSLAIAGLTLVWLYRDWRRTSYPQGADREALERVDYLFLAFIVLVLLTGLLLALSPPIGWDGLSTHLVLVRDFLSDGRLSPSPYSDRPIVGHLVYTWGMALGGDTLPQLLSYGQALLMVAAVAMFGQQHFGRRTAILAAAFLCSVEVFVITATWPYADLPTGMFGLLAILALSNWQLGSANRQIGQANRNLGQRSGRAWLIASVIFAVFAAHSKLNGLFVYVALALGIGLGLWWRRHEIRDRLLDIAIAVAVGLPLAVIWTVVENLLKPESDNAVSQIAGAAASFTATGNEPGVTDLLARIGNYLVVIWEMTVIGQQGGLNYDGTISPFFLILIPLLLILPSKHRVVWALLAAGLIVFAAWLLVPAGYYQNRHLIVVYPIFSILAAYFISRLPDLDHPRFSISGFVRILIVLVFGLQLLFFLSWYQSLDPTAYLLGLQSRDHYLSAHLNGG